MNLLKSLLIAAAAIAGTQASAMSCEDFRQAVLSRGITVKVDFVATQTATTTFGSVSRQAYQRTLKLRPVAASVCKDDHFTWDPEVAIFFNDARVLGFSQIMDITCRTGLGDDEKMRCDGIGAVSFPQDAIRSFANPPGALNVLTTGDRTGGYMGPFGNMPEVIGAKSTTPGLIGVYTAPGSISMQVVIRGIETSI